MRIQETDKVLKEARAARKANVVEGPWLTRPQYAIAAGVAAILVATAGAVWFVLMRKK
jgi:hypothetical protein